MPLPTPGFGRPWLVLCIALAVHVTDEALTDFLSVYNPTVQALGLPFPVFRFDIWLAGLMAAIAALTAVSPFAFCGARRMRPIAWAFATLMLGNAAGHTLGTIAGRTVESVRFDRPMPGFYSSPLLFAAAIWLLLTLWRTGGRHGLSHQ